MKTELSAMFEYADIEGYEAFSQQELESTIFQGLPFVARTTTPEIITCIGCHEACMKQVKKREGKAFIWCDESQDLGYIDLQPEDLNYWKVDVAALAQELAVKLVFSKITEIIKNRVYDIGVIENHTLFLVRGIGWDDAGNILNDSRICNSNPLLITLSAPPADITFPALWIGQLINFSDGELVIDRARLDIALNIKPTGKANIFRQIGKQWHICYDGKEINLPDSKGLHYIQYLLFHPNKEVAAIILQGLQNKNLATDSVFISDDDDLSCDTVQDVAIDRQTILEIRERINKLKKTATNSPEILSLEQYIKNSTHGGKSKALVDANEKSRQAVTNAVNRAITAIEKHHKSLATHLKNNIERGKIYIYKPEKNTNWQ